MFIKTVTGYLVECPTCSSQEHANNLREAKNKYDFHECSNVIRVAYEHSLVTKTYDDTPRVIVPDRAF